MRMYGKLKIQMQTVSIYFNSIFSDTDCDLINYSTSQSLKQSFQSIILVRCVQLIFT